MRRGIGLILVALAAAVGGSGCCRLCHRWCDDGCGCPPCRCHQAAPRYCEPRCECDDGGYLPPPGPRSDTRTRYGDDPPPRRDDRPTGDPHYDRRPTGAYGGTGN